MARKSTLLALAILAAAAFQAVSGGGMSKEARAAQLAQLKSDLKLTAEQARQTEKLLAELEVLRQSIAAAQNSLQAARPPRRARPANIITTSPANPASSEDCDRFAA